MVPNGLVLIDAEPIEDVAGEVTVELHDGPGVMGAWQHQFVERNVTDRVVVRLHPEGIGFQAIHSLVRWWYKIKYLLTNSWIRGQWIDIISTVRIDWFDLVAEEKV